MSRPIRNESLQGSDSTGPGEGHQAKGHNSLGLFVVAENLDTANDTLDVRLEAEGPDGEWSPLRDESGTLVGTLSVADFEDVDGDGTTYNAMLFIHGVPAPSVRANVTGFTDASDSGTTPVADLSVDAYVLAANNAGTGSDYLSGSV